MFLLRTNQSSVDHRRRQQARFCLRLPRYALVEIRFAVLSWYTAHSQLTHVRSRLLNPYRFDTTSGRGPGRVSYQSSLHLRSNLPPSGGNTVATAVLLSPWGIELNVQSASDVSWFACVIAREFLDSGEHFFHGGRRSGRSAQHYLMSLRKPGGQSAVEHVRETPIKLRPVKGLRVRTSHIIKPSCSIRHASRTSYDLPTLANAAAAGVPYATMKNHADS